MLGEVVAARELLATFVAFERLVMSMEGSIVALEVFLTAESAGAERADKSFGWVLGERLFATTAVDRLNGRGGSVRTGGCGMSVGRTYLALGCSGGLLRAGGLLLRGAGSM